MTTTQKLVEFESGLSTRSYEFNPIILESDGINPGDKIRVGGEMQLADVPNLNHRIYPEALWKKCIPEQSTQSRVTNRRMLGELDHPSDGKTHLAQVSHVMTKAELTTSTREKYAGKTAVYAEYETLGTPHGKILAALHRDKIGIQVSSRGDGEVKEDGNSVIVQPDTFYLETWDVVLDPSVDVDTKVLEGIQRKNAVDARSAEAIINAIYGIFESGIYDKNDLLDYAKIIGSINYESLTDFAKVTFLKTRHAINEEYSRSRSKVPEVHPMIPGEGKGTPSQHAQTEIGAMVESQVAERTAQLTTSNTTLTTENADLKKRLAASEQLLRESIIIGKNFEMKMTHFKKQAENFTVTNRRLSAAKAVIEELSGRVKKLVNESKLRQSAEKLAVELVGQVRESKRIAYIDRLLSKEPAKFAESIRPRLLKQTSIPAINEELIYAKSLRSVSSKPSNESQLPPKKTDLTETRRGVATVRTKKTEDKTEDKSPLLDIDETTTNKKDDTTNEMTPLMKESLACTRAVVESMKAR